MRQQIAIMQHPFVADKDNKNALLNLLIITLIYFNEIGITKVFH